MTDERALKEFLENEVNFSITYLRIASEAVSEDHRQAALANAIKSYETAQIFAARYLEGDFKPGFASRLNQVKQRLDNFAAKL